MAIFHAERNRPLPPPSHNAPRCEESSHNAPRCESTTRRVVRRPALIWSSLGERQVFPYRSWIRKNSVPSEFLRIQLRPVVDFFLPLALLLAIMCSSLASTNATAGEPAKEFLARLREAGYFDTAIAYLDRSDKLVGLDGEFKEAIPLEKAQTLIDAAVASRSTSERDAFFLSAQDQLKEFLKKSQHPRLSEARLLLGKLQMVRGGQLMAAPNLTEDQRKEARQSYADATKTFDSIVTDLRTVLEGLKGQRIDAAKEPAKAAQRDQYRYEFLQAQLRGAEARQLAAKTFAKPAVDGKALLEEALKAYTDLSEKYDSYVQGALAMTFRGQVQVELGKTADAIDSFQRVLEQADVEPLRPSRMQAISGLIDLWIAAKPPRLAEAIQLGQEFVNSTRPNEKRLQELQDLQLSLAKAYIANAAELKKSGKKPAEEKRATTNARQLLIDISKVPGPHDAKTKELLSELGIEKAESTEPVIVTNPKSLEEALSAAREYLTSSDELNKLAELLRTQKKSGEEAAAIAEQLKSIEDQLQENRLSTIDVLRRGLAIGSKDSEMLNQAWQYLSYALYQHKLFHEAAVVGQFLARSAPNDTVGLRGGLLALSSIQSLLQSASEEESPMLVRRIESLGEFLVKQWPDDPQAASAKGIMIRLALDKDRWDDARKLLSAMPAGEEKANYQRLMGQLIWNRSLMLRQDQKNAEADGLLPDAATDLRAGLDGIPGNLAGPESMQAALVLTKVELRRGDPKAALNVLDHKKYGPVKSIEKQDEPTDGFKSDLFAAELQAVVGVMTTEGSDVQALLKRATGTMSKLQNSVKGKDDANDRLVRIYLGMARDIREQLDTATPEKKAKLVGAFRVFLDSIAKSSDDPATLQWVGQTLMQMGESSMEPGELKAQGQAKELLESATQTLSSLIEKQGAQASAALKFQLAKAYRLNGEYKQSIDLLEKVLTANPMMIDAQVEAATAYEQWAGTIDPKYAGKAYESALQGARPGPDKKNVIWGWGRISKLVSGREDFRDTFFNARYHVALCRYLMGKAMKSNEIMEQAIKDITQVAALYPELGSPAKRAEFDALMKEIQKSLGKKPEGLPPVAAAAG
jgi:tetratricopeptide (TPR) repeat protein